MLGLQLSLDDLFAYISTIFHLNEKTISPPKT